MSRINQKKVSILNTPRSGNILINTRTQLKERDSIKGDIKTLNIEFAALKSKEAELMNDINLRDSEIAKSKDKANRSKAELEKLKKNEKKT